MTENGDRINKQLPVFLGVWKAKRGHAKAGSQEGWLIFIRMALI